MAPLPHTRVTRDEWVAAALDAIGDVAIDELRVLALAEQLSISRSSFYWYFDDLRGLQDELLERWGRNTESIVERTTRTAPTITTACLGVFECWADASLYDAGLDLAVRDWGRRDRDVAARVREADDRRLDAVATMFAAHGFEPDDALVRARLLYHSQVGYYAVGIDEPMAVRVGYLPYYLQSMTGEAPSAEELAAFAAFAEAVTPEP